MLVLDSGEVVVAGGLRADAGGRRMSAGIDPRQHIWWLASRSLGVVAIVLISLSVGLGLASREGYCAGPVCRPASKRCTRRSP